jgi:hypothetical protein
MQAACATRGLQPTVERMKPSRLTGGRESLAGNSGRKSTPKCLWCWCCVCVCFRPEIGLWCPAINPARPDISRIPCYQPTFGHGSGPTSAFRAVVGRSGRGLGFSERTALQISSRYVPDVFTLGTETPTFVEVFIGHHCGLALTGRARYVSRRTWMGSMVAVFREWHHISVATASQERCSIRDKSGLVGAAC